MTKGLLILVVIALLFTGLTPAHAQLVCKPGFHVKQGTCQPLGWYKLTLCTKLPVLEGHKYHVRPQCR